MSDKKVTSSRQMDQMINVTKPGPIIVLTVLLIMLAAAFVFVFTGRLERTCPVIAHCDGSIDQKSIQTYFREMLSIDDESAYQVLFSYLNQLGEHEQYTLFDTLMPEKDHVKSGIATGCRVRFENGLEGIVIGGTTAAQYDDLHGEFFKYSDDDLYVMNVCPGSEPYVMTYIFTGETAEELKGTYLSGDVITESITLSSILFEDTDE